MHLEGQRGWRAFTESAGRPIIEPMVEPLFDAATARNDKPQSLRIVIGENNADLAVTLGLLLDAEPDMMCVATGGSTAAVLAAADKHAPNAFILDLSLDDGPSLPLISALRERLPSAAIVVFTGHKNELLKEHCLRAGADALVVKSGDFEELTATLRRAVGSARTAGGAGAAL
jgi:DNA-binding NarL/FixJ family response regulator